MKHHSLFLIIFTILCVTCSKANAQNADTSLYKYKLARTWYYNYSENFGVRTNPDSTQKQDKIIFNPNMTYTIVMDGITSSGTWSVSESTHFLTLQDTNTKQARTIKISGLVNDQMALKWQAPDLTAIYKYYYTK